MFCPDPLIFDPSISGLSSLIGMVTTGERTTPLPGLLHEARSPSSADLSPQERSAEALLSYVVDLRPHYFRLRVDDPHNYTAPLTLFLLALCLFSAY